MTKPARGCAAVALAVLALVVVACGAGGGPTISATRTPITKSTNHAPKPHHVTQLVRTYLDETRPTVDPSGVHSSPVRALVTTIRVPDRKGPFPLVVFAHGNSGHPRQVTQLLDTWAGAGFVVAAPAFPLTNDDVDPTVIGDYVQEPADLRTVIEGVLADSNATTDPGARPLARTVDGEHIGVAGHSLGAAAMYGLAANSCCRDDRVDAVVALSGIRLPFPMGTDDPRPIPLLAMHGTADPTIPFSVGRAAYDAWTGPKWFVTLIGALHSQQYEDPPSPYDQIVFDLTTEFWEAALRGDRAAAKRLDDHAPPPALARVEHAGAE
jgi:dienelactone hydrolase